MENKEEAQEEVIETKKEDISEEKSEKTNTNLAVEEKKNGKKVLEFFITTLNGMAYGLFATLIIGTILATIGNFFKNGDNDFCVFMYNVLSISDKAAGKYGAAIILQNLTGAGIGVGVAMALKKKPLEVVVLGGVGELAAVFSLSTKFVTNGTLNNFGSFQIGDPLTIYITVIGVALLMKLLLRKKTPVDILIVPLFAIACALVIGLLVRFPAIYVTYGVQFVVDKATLTVPFLMGIIVAVLMGMALTAPISSAAIGAMVFVASEGAGEGLMIASGAAIVGCCCQMVGFAVQSRRDNSIGMVISIGIGTSMLQFKNILRKPVVWLPTIIASAILGPVSTCWLKLVCMGSSAGMGTSGLVGQIGTFASMGNTWQTWVGIFGLQIILPAVLVFGIDLLFRKFGLIKDGDLKV